MKKKLIAKWTTRFFSQSEINHLSETNKFVYKYAIIGLFILFFPLITFAPAYSAPLVNGGVISEAISVPYEEDSYTFTANAGEGVQIRIADTSSNDFLPRITLYDPNGAYVTYGVGYDVAAISRVVTENGTYTVVVADGSGTKSQTGNYDLYFVHMPGANEGGSLINGGVISDAIDLGDLDSYTFTANAGEGVQIRIADTSSNDFYPRITLYDPNGAYVTYGVGYDVAAISRVVTENGTYTVVVADGSGTKSQTGNYDLYFVHMPGANEGGSLINGGVISDAIDLGDLDSYTFTANAGEGVQIRIADTSSNDFYPRITLYDPNGAYVTYGVGYDVAAISRVVTENGTYTVVVADGSGTKSQTGNYDLYFVHMPGANEGGSLINGGVISDAIDLGDLDSYTFTANAGEGVQIRIADTSSNDFYPRITLYDPNGAYVTYGVGYDVAAISRVVTENGTYTVVVADGSGTKSQTGNYDLYFVHMPGANEGGSLINGGVISDAIDLGDLDSYTFTANAGEEMQIQVADTSSNDFLPRITLYDPNGAYVTYGVGHDVAAISRAVTENGTYTVVVADGSSTKSQTGNYDLYFNAPGGMGLIANAGPDQIICSQLCDGAVLDGRKSYALNSVIASYDWELEHRDDTDYDQTATGETPIIYNLATGIYDVTLTITDDADFQVIDQMILTVIETCNGCSIMKGDLDSDGDVDGNDLRIFSQNYGTVVLTP